LRLVIWPQLLFKILPPLIVLVNKVLAVTSKLLSAVAALGVVRVEERLRMTHCELMNENRKIGEYKVEHSSEPVLKSRTRVPRLVARDGA